jgi:hypothetical protein
MLIAKDSPYSAYLLKAIGARLWIMQGAVR